MKALIGVREPDGQGVAALYVDSLEARPPLRSPENVLQAWSASPEQLRRLVAASRLSTLSADQITFRGETAGVNARFRGARMFGNAMAFWSEAAARECEIAALCANEAPDRNETPDWRVLWPWAEGIRERATQALEQLTRADIKLDAAQTIFTQSRDEPGRRGQSGRAAARQTIDSVHALCTETRQALLRDALESMGAPGDHRIAEEIVDALRRGARAKQHVDVTENAISEAQRLLKVLTEAVRERVRYGEQAATDAPAWVPGRVLNANGHSSGAPPHPRPEVIPTPEPLARISSPAGV